MFSGITSYLWGAAAPAEEGVDSVAADGSTVMPCQPMDDVAAMDVVSVGSDDDLQLTPPHVTSDDEWEVISEDDDDAAAKMEAVRQRRKANQNHFHVDSFEFSRALKQMTGMDEDDCPITRQNNEDKALVDELRRQKEILLRNKIEALSLSKRPTKSRLEPSVQKRRKEPVRDFAEEAKLKTDREAELALLMEELRPARRARRQQEHMQLSRKSLNKSNNAREVQSGGNSVLRRSDRLNPSSCSRANNNRKSQ